MQSQDSGGKGDLLPKPAEMEELWRSWSQGFWGFYRGEGCSNERTRWEKENAGAEGQGTRCWGCQGKLGMGKVGDFREGNPREEGVSLGRLLQRGQGRKECPVFQSKRFPSDPEEGVWSKEQAPGASLARMEKPKPASHKQPRERFCWEMFSNKSLLRVFLAALLRQPAGSSLIPSRDLLSLGAGWTTTLAR